MGIFFHINICYSDKSINKILCSNDLLINAEVSHARTHRYTDTAVAQTMFFQKEAALYLAPKKAGTKLNREKIRILIAQIKADEDKGTYKHMHNNWEEGEATTPKPAAACE